MQEFGIVPYKVADVAVLCLFLFVLSHGITFINLILTATATVIYINLKTEHDEIQKKIANYTKCNYNERGFPAASQPNGRKILQNTPINYR